MKNIFKILLAVAAILGAVMLLLYLEDTNSRWLYVLIIPFAILYGGGTLFLIGYWVWRGARALMGEVDWNDSEDRERVRRKLKEYE